MRRMMLIAVGFACALALSGTNAAATTVPGGQKPTPTGTSSGGTPEVAVLLDGGGNTIASYHRHGSSSGSSGGGATWRCAYYEPTTSGGPIPGVDKTHVATVEVGKRYFLWCDSADQAQVYLELVTWDPQNPFGSLAASDRAAEEARDRVALIVPDIQTSPPAAEAQLVGLATWLWVDQAWQPRTATASLGGVTAQVTATPATIVWSPGDGTPPFTCAGPGERYDRQHPDRVSHCTHTYTTRSTTTDPNGTFPLTATITYDVHWQASNGDAGDLDPVTRTTTIPLVVREAQAVIE